MSREEEKLVANANAGDKVALQSLLLMHYSDIEVTIRQHLGADLAAKLEVQDVMQEVLVTAYKNISRFTPTDAGSFRSWLKRIAANRVVDAARKFQRVKRGGQAAHIAIHRSATESLDEIWEWVFSESNPPDRPARRREAHEALQVCLARLEDCQREAVVAHYFEAQDVQQVAKRMNRSPGAVRELLRRARANLAKDLDTASKWLSSR
jgi:RNA polymerase sigma-70 factor (ECF subfamily)